MIKDLYNMNETIAAELFDGLTYPWEALPKIRQRISVRICTWTGDHRKRRRSSSLCIYPWQCHCR